MAAPFVSVVIPVLDDDELVTRMLPSLVHGESEVEIVVASGNDPPRASLLELMGSCPEVVVLSSLPGRARQMNLGASAARGRWLLFLHADTRLFPGWMDEVRRADADPAVVAGSFCFQLDSPRWQARLIERGVRRRVRWFDLAYGDQGLFVRREIFAELDGYREWPLMEDLDLIRRLRRMGRLWHSASPALTSARRWERDGWWRRSGRNVLFQMLFVAGASPGWLATRYSKARRQGSASALVIMARAPSDARGKSRLMQALWRDGPEAAGDRIGLEANPRAVARRTDEADLKRCLLLDTLASVRRVAGVDVFVAFEPAVGVLEMQALVGHAARMFPQRGETLGDRMHQAFAALFALGYSSVVMVGSDLPTLPASHVEQAFHRLADPGPAAGGFRGRNHAANTVVVGPATDGGYYLIGLRALHTELFKSIPWSTPEVFAETLRNAERLRLEVSLVPPWYDVDEPEDLRRVASEPEPAEHTRSWILSHPEFFRGSPFRKNHVARNR